MGYFDFQKKSDCIVCIDSDGCAMDTDGSKAQNLLRTAVDQNIRTDGA